jgi:hypothetical protein
VPGRERKHTKSTMKANWTIVFSRLRLQWYTKAVGSDQVPLRKNLVSRQPVMARLPLFRLIAVRFIPSEGIVV